MILCSFVYKTKRFVYGRKCLQILTKLIMQEFEAKRKALFACLDDASTELKGTSLEQPITVNPISGSLTDDTVMVYRHGGNRRNHNAAVDRGLRHLRGKESLFKKPELPIARCLKPKRLPDYQVNPHKWKKYSLEDVDISDHTNTSAALDFLRTIDTQKEDRESDDGDESTNLSQRKIEFKKTSKIRRNMRSIEAQEQRDVEIDTPKLKGSKLVMPEYVVGVKVTKGPQKRNANTMSTKSEKKERAAGKLLLSHLQEEDGDIEEE